MEYIFNEDGSKININELEFFSDKGSQFKVYKYNDSVIKLYRRKPQILNMALKKLNTLKNIPTRRILLPTGVVFDDKEELCGYKMPLINNEKKIGKDKLGLFLIELEVLKKDLELLSDNYVTLRDISFANTIYNGHVYLIDPGNYSINELNTTILRMNTENPILEKKLKPLIEKHEYSRITEIVESLSDREKKEILRLWNYDKINRLIEMLLFSNKGFDNYKYYQIIQFFIKERKNNNLIYDLDLLKMYFNKELNIDDSINDFVKRKIKENKGERKLFESIY